MEEKFGKQLHKYRVTAGYNQNELGKKLGVTGKCVSSWETGRTEPDIGTVQRMSEIFGCSVPELMGLKSGWVGTPVNTAQPLPQSHSIDEQILLDGYKDLDAERKKRVLEYILMLSSAKKGE